MIPGFDAAGEDDEFERAPILRQSVLPLLLDAEAGAGLPLCLLLAPSRTPAATVARLTALSV